MTTIQICALIALIVLVSLIYWMGYRTGLNDGRSEGLEEGKSIQESDSSESSRSLQLPLDQSTKEAV